MSLRLIEGGKGKAGGGAVEAEATEIAKVDAAAKGGAKAKSKATAAPLGARALAPGAPLSPGTLPLEFAVLLRSGEALIWWNEKERIAVRPILVVVAICAAVLALITGFAPDFWIQPWETLWPPLAALFSPVLAVLVREALAIRATIITDGAVVDVPRFGEPRRLAIGAIEAVRRDLWTGGVRLEGKGARVRIPPSLADDARRAIASTRRAIVRSREVDDPLAWLPGVRR